MLCPLAAGGEKKAAAPAGPTPVGLVPMDGMMKAVAKNMEKTLDVPIFRVSRTITTDKFDELYKVRGAKECWKEEWNTDRFFLSEGEGSTLNEPSVPCIQYLLNVPYVEAGLWCPMLGMFLHLVFPLYVCVCLPGSAEGEAPGRHGVGPARQGRRQHARQGADAHKQEPNESICPEDT